MTNQIEPFKPNQEEEGASVHFLDYWRVIRARKEIILAVMLLVIVTGTFVTYLLPKIYAGRCLIRVQQDAPDMHFLDRKSANAYNPYFMLTEYEVIQSTPIIEKVVRNLRLHETWGKDLMEDGSPISLQDAVKILRSPKKLKVSQHRNTSLISITFLGEDPQECSEVANMIAEVYEESRTQAVIQNLTRGIDTLKQELQRQKEKVDTAEEEVERIRKERGIAYIGQNIKLDSMKLRQLEADRISTRVDVIQRKARLEELEKLGGDDLAKISSVMVFDRTLENVRAQLMDSEVALTLLMETYAENHPDVTRMKAGIRELRSKLDQAIEGLKAGLRADYNVSVARLKALEEELAIARKADISEQGDKYLPFEKAQRELYIERGVLEMLSARLREEGIGRELPRTPVELIERAEAPKIRNYVSPNVYLNIGLSVVVGLGLGIGLAYFIEYLDTSVKNVDDIEKFLGLPVIGVIPQRVKPLNQEGADSPHAESYRVLRTNIQFANNGVGSGAFAVISGGVGEGKSTTLFNLAYICASMGDKVLVVDSDMRRPVQHTMMGISNQFGLTNVLMRDVPIEETIKPTSVPNLHFLPSGKLPRASVGLMDNQRVRELVKNLKARYDYVFFDSPPVIGVSDSSIIASEVDGVLLVVQYRKYPRAMSARAKRLIENVGGNILGVVLNNINILRDDYYYYYQSYYSHYTGPENQKASPELAATGRNEERL